MAILEHAPVHEAGERGLGIGWGGRLGSGRGQLVELEDPVERRAVVGLLVRAHERPDARVEGIVVVEVLAVVVVGHVREAACGLAGGVARAARRVFSPRRRRV